MANHRRDPRKEQLWRGHLDAQKLSGLSVREFCRRHRLAEASFYYWRDVLAKRDSQDPPSKPTTPTPATRHDDTTTLPLFLPLTLQPQPQPIAVLLADGTRLRVPHDFDPDCLRQILAVLREVSC